MQSALLLHRRPYRESSLLIEAFTAEQGRIGLVARGVRRERSRLAGVLQPLQPLLIDWSGRGDLFTLTRVEPAGAPLQLSGDALYSALYVNELLMRLLQRHLPEPGLYQAYLQVLNNLARSHATDWVLRQFERSLLEALGYAIDWLHTSDGVAVSADEHYLYRRQIGLERCPPGSRGVVVSGAALQALYLGETVPGDSARRELRTLLRNLLHEHLGPRPLASRELMRHHRAQAELTKRRDAR